MYCIQGLLAFWPPRLWNFSGPCHSALMEQLRVIRHRCVQLISRDTGRGWYSPPSSLPAKSSQDAQDPAVQRLSGKRRVVVARWNPHHAEHQNISKGFQNNSIRTTKYNLISFIPMNLFQQFHRSDVYS